MHAEWVLTRRSQRAGSGAPDLTRRPRRPVLRPGGG